MHEYIIYETSFSYSKCVYAFVYICNLNSKLTLQNTSHDTDYLNYCLVNRHINQQILPIQEFISSSILNKNRRATVYSDSRLPRLKINALEHTKCEKSLLKIA